MHNNSFPITSHKQLTKNMTQQVTRPPRRKWATFTYVGKETHHITNIFRHTYIQIAFRTNNTIQNLLTRRNLNPDKLSSSGVFKLTRPECGKAYVGQTGAFLSTLQGAQTCLLQQHPILQFRTTPRRGAPFRPHPRNHASTTSSQQRPPSQHYGKILYLR
jgi:hypothetical protein